MAGERAPGGAKRPEVDRGLRQRRTEMGRRWALPAFVLGCLLGRSSLLGLPGLYGIALAAALGPVRSPGSRLWAVVGCLVGSLSLATVGPVSGGASAAAGTLLAALLPWRGPAGQLGPAIRGAAGGLLAAVLFWRVPPWGSSALVLGLAAGLTGALAGVLARGLEGLETPEGALLPEGLLAGALVGAGALAAVPMRVDIGGVSVPLAAAVASALVATVAWGWGGLHGAAVGVLVVLGRALALAPGFLPGPGELGIAYAAAGLAAGGCRTAGRPGVVLGYGLTFLLLSLHGPGPGAEAFREAGAALAGVVLVAPFWPGLRRLQPWGLRRQAPARPTAPAPEGREDGEVAAGVLATAVEALAQVLRSMRRPAPGTGAAEAAATASDPLAPIVGEVHERVCQGCSMKRQCWEVHFHRTYQVFGQLWEGIEREGAWASRTPPAGLACFCRYASEVVAVMNGVFDLYAARQQWERRLEEGRQMVAEHLSGMARLLDTLAAEVRTAADGPPGEGSPARPVLFVQAYTARIAKRGNLVSGDSTMAVPIGKHRYLLALSDGMGAGREAAEESRLALSALQTLLQAGYRLESAIQTVNSCLVLRQGGDRFATLDVVLIDCLTGRAQFAKVGAAPALLRKGTRVQVLRAEAPPAGVLEPLPLEIQERVLHPGDCVLLVSDGVWEVKGGGRREGEWLIRFLQAEPAPDRPETLAEALLARALEQVAGPEDDMTILVAYIEAGDPEARTGPDGAGMPRRPGEPVPVRRALRHP